MSPRTAAPARPLARAAEGREPAARAAVVAACESSAALVAAAVEHADRLVEAVALAAGALRRGGQVLFCGNGGSAAQAAHLACELSGRFYLDRPALRAVALGGNVAATTAISNDYGYERLFERELEALARPGDVLVALTTSGRSPNVRRAVAAAGRLGLKTIGFTGRHGQSFAKSCDLGFVVPAADTARIQEIHLLLGHVLCAQVEAELFPPAPAGPRRP